MIGKAKKIGLIGWWGGKNEGDRYILEVLKRYFGGKFNLYLKKIPFNMNLLSLRWFNKLDFVLIGGGGLFTGRPPRPFSSFDRWCSRIKTPIGFLGIGVEEVTPEYIHVFKEILNKSAFFIVRDSGSYDLIRNYSDNILKAPDLSFLYPRQLTYEEKPTAVGINLRIWNFDKKRTYDNEAWSRAIKSLPGEKETIPLSFLSDLEDTQAMKHIDGKQNTEFNINIYRKVKVMIGMRLHSLIFAAHNSIPIIGISYAPKVRRFFQEVGLDEFCLNLDEYGRLKEVFVLVMRRHEEISKTLADYTKISRAALEDRMVKVNETIRMI